jgi:DNA repair protein RecO (recombination protein O)
LSAEKAVAIVVRAIDFSESSTIVTLFTREFGKIGALAKGGRRPKGPFEAALDLLGLVRVVFLRKSGDTLDLLTEAKLERRFRARSLSLSNLYAGYYIAELLKDLTDDYDPHPELFDRADFALAALNTETDVPRITLQFEIHAIRLLGHLPSLELCVDCGQQAVVHSMPDGGQKPSGRHYFGFDAGGVLCGRCRMAHRNVASLSQAAISGLQKLSHDSKTLELEPEELRSEGEIRGVIRRYLCHLTGRSFRMHTLLASMSQ